MKKKIFKCLSVFLAGWMCLPAWGTATLTSLNSGNDLTSMSANIYSIKENGAAASIEYAKNTAWMRWQSFSMDKDTSLQFSNCTGGGRMYFIVDGGNGSFLNGKIDAGSNSGFYLINPSGIAVGANASFNFNGSINASYGLTVGKVVGGFGDVFREDGTIATSGGFPLIDTYTGISGSLSIDKAQLVTQEGMSLLLAAKEISLGQGLIVENSAAPDIVLASGQSVPLGSLNISSLNPSDLGGLADLSVSSDGNGVIAGNALPSVTLVASGAITLTGGGGTDFTIKGSSIAVRAGGKEGEHGDVILSDSLKLISDRIILSSDEGSITLEEGVKFDGSANAVAQLSAAGNVTLNRTKIGDTTQSASLTVRAGGDIALVGGSVKDKNSSLRLNTVALDAEAGGNIGLSGYVLKKTVTAGGGQFSMTAGGTITQAGSESDALRFEGTKRDTVSLTAGNASTDGYAIRLDGVGNDGLFNQVLELCAVDNVGTAARNVLLSSAGSYNADGVFRSSSVGGVLELVSKYATPVTVKRESFDRLDGLSVETAGGSIQISDDASAERNTGIYGLKSQGGEINVSARNVYTAEGASIDATGESVGNVSFSTRNLTLADGTTVKGGTVRMVSSDQNSALRIGDGVTVEATGDLALNSGNIDIGSRTGDATTLTAAGALTVTQTGENVAPQGATYMGDHLYVEENVKLVSKKDDGNGVSLNYAGELWLFGQAMNQGANPQKAAVEKTSANAQLKAMALDMVGGDLELADDGTWSDVHWIGYYNVGENVTVKDDIVLTPTTGTGLPTDDRASYIRGAGNLTFSVADGKTLTTEGGFTLAANGNLKLAGNGTLDTGSAALSLSGKNVTQSEFGAGQLKAGSVSLMERSADEGLNQSVTLSRLQTDALSGVGGKVQITAAANKNDADFTIAGDLTVGSLTLDAVNRNVVSGLVRDEGDVRTAYTTAGTLSIQAGADKSVSLTTSGDFNFIAKDTLGKDMVSLLAKSADLTVVNVDEKVAHEVQIGLASLEELTLNTVSPGSSVGESQVSVAVKNASGNLKVVNANNVSGEFVDLMSLSVDQTGDLQLDQKIATSGDLTLRATGSLGLATEEIGGENVSAANDVRGKVSLASGNNLVFRNEGNLTLAEYTALSESPDQTVTLKSDNGKIVIDESALNLNGKLNLEAKQYAGLDDAAVAIADQKAYDSGTGKGWNGVLGEVDANGSVSVSTLGALTLAGDVKAGGAGNVTLTAGDNLDQDTDKKIVADGLLTVNGGADVNLLGANEIKRLTGSSGSDNDFNVRVANGVNVDDVTACGIDIAANGVLTVNGCLGAKTVRLTGENVSLNNSADFNVRKDGSTEIVTAKEFSLTLKNREGKNDQYGTLSVVAGTDAKAEKITITDARGSGSSSLDIGSLKGSDIKVTSEYSDLQVAGTIDAQGDITVRSGEELTLGMYSLVSSENGNIVLKGDKGVSQSQKGVIKAVAGDVTVATKEDLASTVALNGSVVAGKTFAVTSGKGLTLRNVQAAEDMTLAVELGDITLNGVVEVTADSAQIQATASSGALYVNGTIAANGTGGKVKLTGETGVYQLNERESVLEAEEAIEVVATGTGSDVSLARVKAGSVNATAESGNVTVNNQVKADKGVVKLIAGNNVTVDGAVEATAGNATLEAGQTLKVNGSVTAKKSVTLTAKKGDVTVDGAAEATEGGATLTAGGTLSVAGSEGSGIDAKTDAILNGAKIVVNGAVVAGGKVQATATKGDLTVGGDVTGQSAELTTSAELTLGRSVVATVGDVLLTGKAGIEQKSGTVQAKRNVTVLADGDGADVALKGKVAAGQAVAMTAAGDLSAADVEGKTVTATAGNDVTLKKVEAGTLTATATSGDLTVDGAVEATAGNATLEAGQTLKVNGSVTAKKSVTLTAKKGDVTVDGAAEATEGGATLTAAGTLSVAGSEGSGVKAKTDAILNGAEIAVAGAVVADGKVQATATTGDLTVEGDVTGQSAELTTSAELTLGRSVVATVGDVLLTGKAGIEQKSGTVQAKRNVTVLADGDGADVALKGNVAADQAVVMTAAGDLSAADIKGKTVTATAGNDVTLKKVEAGTLTATATAGDLTVDGAVKTSAGEAVLTAGQELTVSGGSDSGIDAKTDAILNGAAIVVNGAVVAGGKVQAQAATGDLKVEGAVTANGGTLTLAAENGDITVKTLTARDDLTVTAGGKVAVNGNVTSTAGGVKLEGDSVSASGAVSAGNDLYVAARDGDLILNGVVTVGGKTRLAATEGDVRANNSKNDFGGTVTATADGDIALANRTDETLTVGDLTAGDAGTITLTTGGLKSDGTIALSAETVKIAAEGVVDIALLEGRTIDSLKAAEATISAEDGELTITASKTSKTGQALKLALTAPDGVTVQKNVGDLELSAVASDGAVAVTTSGDLDVSTLTAGGAVTLNATGSDADIRAESAVQIGGDVSLSANGDIVMDSIGNKISGTVTALSTGGDVSLANSSALTVDELQAATAILWAKGDVVVDKASVDKVAATAQNGIFDFTNDRDLTLLALTSASATLAVQGNLSAPNVVNITSGDVALDVLGTVELHNQGNLTISSEGVLDVNGISSEKGNVTIAAAKIVQTTDSSVEDDNGVVDISGLKAGIVAKNGVVTLTATKGEEKTEGEDEGEEEGETIANAGFIGEAGAYVTVEAKTVNADAEGEMHLARLNADWIIGSASDGSVQYQNLLDLVVDGKIGTASDYAYTGSDVSLTADGYTGIQNLDMDDGGVLAVKRTVGSSAPQFPMFRTVNGSSVPTVTTWDPHNQVYVIINGTQYPMTPEFQHQQTLSGSTLPNLSSPSIGPVILTPQLFGLMNPFWITTDLGTVDLIGCGMIDLQLDKSVEVETKGDWPAEKKVKTHAKNLSPADTVFCGRTVSMK